MRRSPFDVEAGARSSARHADQAQRARGELDVHGAAVPWAIERHDTCHHTYEQDICNDGALAQQKGPVVVGVHQGGVLHFTLPGLPSPMESLWSAQRSKVRLRKYFGD